MALFLNAKLRRHTSLLKKLNLMSRYNCFIQSRLQPVAANPYAIIAGAAATLISTVRSYPICFFLEQIENVHECCFRPQVTNNPSKDYVAQSVKTIRKPNAGKLTLHSSEGNATDRAFLIQNCLAFYLYNILERWPSFLIFSAFQYSSLKEHLMSWL